MKKSVHKFEFTHVTADGTVMTDTEFLANPPRPSAAKNADLLNNLAYQLSPEFRATERAKRRFELAEKKKAQLDREQAELDRKRAEL